MANTRLTKVQEVETRPDSFEAAVKGIADQALALNMIQLTFNSIVSLIENPEAHVKKIMLPGGSIIDERKQQREFNAFMEGKDYQELNKAVAALKINFNWFFLIQGIEFVRTAGGTYGVRLVEPQTSLNHFS